MRIWIGGGLALSAALSAVVAAHALRGADADPPTARAPRAPQVAPPRVAPPRALPMRPAERRPRIRWRRSVAVGSPTAGRLVRGVRLPAAGAAFYTWDPVRHRSPNRAWRRWGTDRLVRTLLHVARAHRAAHPRAPRIGIGDLSRPRGGDFGIRYGPIGHASHQNGLDADVYYPRTDGREAAPRHVSQIDRRLAQDLVDRFLRRGAEVIFVGPGTGLSGPPGRVQPLANHDNHLHVRLPAQRRERGHDD